VFFLVFSIRRAGDNPIIEREITHYIYLNLNSDVKSFKKEVAELEYS
jgi:hypothetical protein